MVSSIVRLVSVALACALATPASADLLARKDLSLATALTIATTAAETCKAQGQRVSVTVVGRNGEVIVQLRGDNASPHTMIAAQGALPIMVGTDVIGAAGVSGAVTTPESPGGVKDEACVKAGIDRIADQLK